MFASVYSMLNSLLFLLLASVALVSTTDCPAGTYVAHNGFCYYRSNTSKSWEDAANICKSMNGILPVTKDLEKNNFLADVLKELYLYKSWLGVVRNPSEDWVDDQGVGLNYTRWGPNEPKEDNTCAGIENSGLWSSCRCETVGTYVCQITPGSGKNFLRSNRISV